MRSNLRSRQGCITCRKRHKKCDEERPRCRACTKSGIECEYSVKLRWIENGSPSSFRSTTRPKNTSRAHIGILEVQPTATNSLNQLSTTHHVSGSQNSLTTTTFPQQTSPPDEQKELDTYDPTSYIYNNENYDILESDMGSFEDSSPSSATEPPELERSEEMSEGSLVASPPDVWILDDKMFDDTLALCFETPGERIAYAYYFKHVSACIPALDGAQNPYRKLSTMALASPVLLKTIISVATAHMLIQGRSNAELVFARQSRALRSLQEALSALETRDDSRESSHTTDVTQLTKTASLSAKEEALATILLQITNVVMTGSTEVEAHLKCAFHFLEELDYVYKPLHGFTSRVLVQRFAMIDVVTSILRHQRPYAPPDFWMHSIHENLDHTEPSFREMTGCPQAVLSFLARISNLACEMIENEDQSAYTLARAFTLETELRVWGSSRFPIRTMTEIQKASIPSDGGDSNESDLSRLYLNVLSECFYWTAHLLLQRRVFRDATDSIRVQQIAKTIFRLIDSIPVGSGPDSSLPLPLYMSAREAITPEDRSWVRRIHTAMKDVHRDVSRDHMMNITEEIWRWTDNRRQVGVEKDINENFIRTLEQKSRHFMF
ncbi:MAG: hypothetical protein M1834_001113 [Cirrosporium novae-zelandiae]|nr:MAG: hypothetical protein M1834_001113 [Cirrosporium novae-zelandiae]